MSIPRFIGDLHFGHRNILKYRPQFSTIEEHDETLLDNILTTCRKRDPLWLMGDCFFDMQSLSMLELLSSQIQLINLIIGNHDTDSGERQKVLMTALNSGRIHRVHSLFKYNGYWLSHAPIHPDELRGKGNIHGHTHGHKIDDPRYVGVSCEQVDYKPISLPEILERAA